MNKITNCEKCDNLTLRNVIEICNINKDRISSSRHSLKSYMEMEFKDIPPFYKNNIDNIISSMDLEIMNFNKFLVVGNLKEIGIKNIVEFRQYKTRNYEYIIKSIKEDKLLLKILRIRNIIYSFTNNNLF